MSMNNASQFQHSPVSINLLTFYWQYFQRTKVNGMKGQQTMVVCNYHNGNVGSYCFSVAWRGANEPQVARAQTPFVSGSALCHHYLDGIIIG